MLCTLDWQIRQSLDEAELLVGFASWRVYIEAVVLKGRSIAQYYFMPEHYYSCDLDLFVTGDGERTCKILEAKGIRLECEVYKEVEFSFEGVYVELHRYVIPVRGNKTLLRFERHLSDTQLFIETRNAVFKFRHNRACLVYERLRHGNFGEGEL